MFLTPKFAFALPPSSVNLRHFDCKLTTIFELDWEKVPEGIFDEDDSNAIEV